MSFPGERRPHAARVPEARLPYAWPLSRHRDAGKPRRCRRLGRGSDNSDTTAVIIRRLRSFDEYQRHRERMAQVYAQRRAFERNLQPGHGEAFTVSGFSYPAGKLVDFRADFAYAHGEDVNWREWLVCPVTGLNNRLRAAVHMADSELGLIPGESTYITEQVTPLYEYLSKRHAGIVGSEFLGDVVAYGSRDKRGVRNEDLTRLTFPDESFDVVLSFDCFEHN